MRLWGIALRIERRPFTVEPMKERASDEAVQAIAECLVQTSQGQPRCTARVIALQMRTVAGGIHAGTVHRFANTTDVIAAMEDILNLDRMSKFDYFSRSLADVFSDIPNLTPYTALTPQQDMNEVNPKNSAAGEMSKALDFSKPDRIDDGVFNRILWRMMKGDEAFPVVGAKSPLHALQMSR